MVQTTDVLQYLWIAHQPLAAAPAVSITTGGGDTRSVSGQPLVGRPQADLALTRQINEELSASIVATPSRSRLTHFSWVQLASAP